MKLKRQTRLFAYSAVYIMNLSTVRISSFNHFTKASDILASSISTEKYENYFFKIYIFWHTCMWMYVVILR